MGAFDNWRRAEAWNLFLAEALELNASALIGCSAVVGRTTNLPIEMRTLCHWAIAARRPLEASVCVCNKRRCSILLLLQAVWLSWYSVGAGHQHMRRVFQEVERSWKSKSAFRMSWCMAIFEKVYIILIYIFMTIFHKFLSHIPVSF